MTRENYRQALEAAYREYEETALKQAALDKRIDQLHETINALTRLCGLTPTVSWGLTDACRAILRRSDDSLTPIQVRQRLELVGFDLARYANELAAIHTTLKRLATGGEAKRVTRPSGEQAYVWVRVRAAMTLDEALKQVWFELPREPHKTGRGKT